MRSLVLLGLGLVAGCAPPARAVGTGHFVTDEAIAAVKVCETRGDEVLASFGTPTARGRDDDFTTYQWISMVGARDMTHAVVRSQTIGVWVDRSGRVARIVVNPATMPSTPSACPTGAAEKAATKDVKPAASKAKTR